jgi:4-amino-4-deoxy-L-arabinose transferase-like glycosyltransferase
MKNLKLSYIWFIFSLIFLSLIAFISAKLPFRGDEKHLVETIRLFANNFSFETLKNYPEVTPPFFFIFYALWAKIFGSTIESLRILTLIISLITWQLVFYLISLFVKKNIHVLLLSFLVVINPYFLGTSVFVFTDMLTIMLCLSAVILFLKDKYYLFLIFCSLAILCRQYAIIFPLSIIAFSIINLFNGKPINKRYIFGTALTFLPLLILFFIWGNVAPLNGIQKWIVLAPHFYNISYINTYITFSVVYLLPLIIVFLYKRIGLNFLNVAFALIICLIILQFPITPSAAAILQTDIRTVGFAHIALIKLLGEESLTLRIILGVLLFVGCFINVVLIKYFLKDIKNKIYRREMIFIIIWILFLIIMPLSYQVWEKYLTMGLPFLMLSIYFLINNEPTITKDQL